MKAMTHHVLLTNRGEVSLSIPNPAPRVVMYLPSSCLTALGNYITTRGDGEGDTSPLFVSKNIVRHCYHAAATAHTPLDGSPMIRRSTVASEEENTGL